MTLRQSDECGYISSSYLRDCTFSSQLGVLSCHIHLLYEKELHKSLSRQVVYSFYEICNGHVALVKLISLVGIYVYIQSIYFCVLLLTEPSGLL